MRTENPKTGDMAQTWILRSDVAPHDALHSGEDRSVCGNCVLRPLTAKGTGGPVCYATCSGGRAAIVNLWRSWEMGNIPVLSPAEAATLLAGRQVRLGSYGDPAALPFEAWEGLLVGCAGHVGYTHQWRDCDPRFARVCMASVETPEQRETAKAAGWRTFRVEGKGHHEIHEEHEKRQNGPEGSFRVFSCGSWFDRLPGEVVCPGSREAGRKLTCKECLACDGNASGRRGDVVILAHGSGRHGR